LPYAPLGVQFGELSGLVEHLGGSAQEQRMTLDLRN
jgi:hypothetical protein